jgi:hypothetical protein
LTAVRRAAPVDAAAGEQENSIAVGLPRLRAHRRRRRMLPACARARQLRGAE